MKKPLLSLKKEVIKEIKTNRALRTQLSVAMKVDITTIERWIKTAPWMLTDDRSMKVLAIHCQETKINLLEIDPSIKSSLLQTKQPA